MGATVDVPCRARDTEHFTGEAASAAFDSLATIFAPGCRVTLGATPLGRGLVSLGDVAPGMPLLSVDRATLLCVSDAPGSSGGAYGREALAEWQMLHGALPPLLTNYLLSDGTGWFLRMTAWLLWLAAKGSGPWRQCIRLLPRGRDLTCLMNFSAEEAAELQVPQLIALARKEREAILGLHERIYSISSGELRVLGLADSPAETLWAAACINSRSFSEQVGQELVSLLVPCVDMANHSNRPRATYRFNPTTSCFDIVASREIRAGQEVTISYGCSHKANEALMKDYGFALPGNVNDRITFSTAKDVLSGAGRCAPLAVNGTRLAEAAGAMAWGGDGWAARRGAALQANAAEGAALGVERQRQQAVLMSLKPLFSSMPPGAQFTEMELQAERLSVAALCQQCNDALAGLGTTIETDDALLRGEGGELSVCHRAAVVVRLERKLLLRTAVQMLERYAVTLS